MQRERLAAKDVPAERIAHVRCPVGLDIGAQTPEEIAIAVCAELVATRRGSESGGTEKAAKGS
jgi:xanthine dehydrogenase accessory factor